MPGTRSPMPNPPQPDYSGARNSRDDLEAKNPNELASLIEGEIIPRLLWSHRGEPRQDADGRRDHIDAEQTKGFAQMVLRLEAHHLMDIAEGYVLRGASVEAVLLDLIAPAARQLGTWWEEDACNFVDVTMGLWRLQQMVYDISARYPGKASPADRVRRGLFSVIPGSQHSFGVILVEECFRRHGWLTTGLTTATDQQILRLASEQHFDLIALSVNRDAEVEAATALIGKLRANSRNPSLTIMVGGHILNQRPELVQEMGADTTETDGERAVRRIDFLMQMLDERAISSC
jgi:MerR family transcriptional regulator, light-induced transcriptional regulator